MEVSKFQTFPTLPKLNSNIPPTNLAYKFFPAVPIPTMPWFAQVRYLGITLTPIFLSFLVSQHIILPPPSTYIHKSIISHKAPTTIWSNSPLSFNLVWWDSLLTGLSDLTVALNIVYAQPTYISVIMPSNLKYSSAQIFQQLFVSLELTPLSLCSITCFHNCLFDSIPHFSPLGFYFYHRGFFYGKRGGGKCRSSWKFLIL